MINNNQIIRAIGIDVHKDSYSISAFDPQTTNFSALCAGLEYAQKTA